MALFLTTGAGRLGPALLAGALALPAPALTHAARGKADPEDEAGFTDPTGRRMPRRHRFRLGLEMHYVRLTAALAPDGTSQRFHLAPLGVDLAYQLQFLKYLMVRPAFAVKVNVANTNTAMPVHIHPKLHLGYQGALFGAAVGYGYFTPVFYQGNAEDPIRGGLGQPIALHNHHLDLELSLTTRVDRGALSFIARGSMVNTKVWHFDIQGKRRWRPMITFGAGWYFGPRRTPEEREARQRSRARD